MAQPPYKAPPPPAKPLPKSDDKKNDAHAAQGKDQHIPLKDPAEGKPPAVIERAPRVEAEAGPGGYGPTIGVMGLPIEDGERDPDTIAEEQRRRSAEMEAMGMAKWNAAHDELSDEERSGARQVAGAAPPPRIEGEKRIAPPRP